MNLGNKLILLLLLPLVTVFVLSYLFLDEINLSKLGLTSQIINSTISKIDFNPFNNSQFDFDDYSLIPVLSCDPGQAYFKQVKNPLAITWTGKTRSIMQSGGYYAFEKIPEDSRYPLFGGSFADGKTVDLSGTYKVSGLLLGIECGDYTSIFGANSHPVVNIVEIQKIN